MIEMLVGAAIFGGGQAVGFLLGRRRRRPAIEAAPVQPVCGCTHEWAYHDGQAGKCHGTVKVTVKEGEPILDKGRRYIVGHSGAVYEWHECPCRRYSGPEPLPQFYAPELPR